MIEGVVIMGTTMLVSPVALLIVGSIYALICFYVGRFSMDLDYRYRAKQAKKKQAKKANHGISSTPN